MSLDALRIPFGQPGRFGRVAVLLGGESSEREVSLASGSNVLAALQERGVDARPVDGLGELARQLDAGSIDRVFHILHGQHGGGEDGVLQGMLEAAGVPYTGSKVLGSALSMDKIRSKQLWQGVGLPTPRYLALPPGGDVEEAAAGLGYPLILKPACEGSSVGVSRVFGAADLPAAAQLAANYPGDLLLETLIQDGGEYTVGILGTTALPSIRIVPAGEYYDYHAKYQAEDTQYLCGTLDAATEKLLGELALASFEALGCSGWGRVDLMRDGAGKFWLLEVNTAPGMTSHSLVPKAAAQLGIDFSELCWRILETSLEEGV